MTRPTLNCPKGSRYIVSLSGGLDSSVLAYALIRTCGLTVKTLTIDYGQKHAREFQSAVQISSELNVGHRIVRLTDLVPLFGADTSLLNRNIPVPEGHYADESMKSTVVPNRNMLLISVATAWSVGSKFDGVAYAAHAGDHTIYPDCRPEFADAMNSAMRLCDFTSQELVRPFVMLSKADIVKIGSDLGVPFAKTWSCYNGRVRHCGKCGTCVERIEAFKLAGVSDPTEYE